MRSIHRPLTLVSCKYRATYLGALTRTLRRYWHAHRFTLKRFSPVGCLERSKVDNISMVKDVPHKLATNIPTDLNHALQFPHVLHSPNAFPCRTYPDSTYPTGLYCASNIPQPPTLRFPQIPQCS